MHSHQHSGFSLIEMVIVIILTAIISAALFAIIRGPLLAYSQVEQRVVLADIIDTAMQRMTREIRLALPYSVRADTPGGFEAVEFLRTLDGGRYRNQGADRLKFNQSSGTFEVFNTLVNSAVIDTAVTAGPSTECIASTADCLVVYNIGQPTSIASAVTLGISANAYLGASSLYDGNIAAVSSAGPNSIGFDNSDLTWHFSLQSPRQRFHIIDTPVSFVCVGSEIYRYSDYPILESQDDSPGGNMSLLINQVSNCDFEYEKPSLTRFGLLSINLEVTDADSSESVSLLQQIHITNIP